MRHPAMRIAAVAAGLALLAGQLAGCARPNLYD
jgi:hypothetical protein